MDSYAYSQPPWTFRSPHLDGHPSPHNEHDCHDLPQGYLNVNCTLSVAGRLYATPRTMITAYWSLHDLTSRASFWPKSRISLRE